MTFKEACKSIKNHSEAGNPESFMYMVLMCQVSGEIGNVDLQKIYNELIAAFKSINDELNFKSESKAMVPRQLALDISAILTEGWESYDWWGENNYLPKEFLQHFSEILQNLGFAWCRILDGVTEDLEDAIEKRNRS